MGREAGELARSLRHAVRSYTPDPQQMKEIRDVIGETRKRIEAILAAWYELQNCAPSEKARWGKQRNDLLDQAVAGTRSCPQELLEALRPRFDEYKLARRKEHQAKMAQILHKP